MRQIFFFDSLLTPKILLACYWLSLLGVVISGFISLAVTHSFSFWQLLVGLGMMVGIRISFEMIMIMFKMAEYLRRIAENQPKRDANQ